MNSVKKVNGKAVVVNENGEQQKYNKLTFVNEKYSVYSRGGNQPNRVRCELECSLNFWKRFASGYKNRFDPTCVMDKYGINGNGDFTVVAHAALNPADTFDESLGRHLAQSRAKAAAYDKASRIVADIIADLKSTIDFLDSSKVFYDAMISAENAHINNDLLK